MRILQIIGAKEIGGGSQEHTRFLSKGLIERGHKVWIISRPGELSLHYKEEGIPAISLELRERKKAKYFIRYFIRENSIEVVHTHNRDADIPGLLASKNLRGVLKISTIHAFLHRDKFGEPKMNFPLWIYNRILKKIPDKIITVSESLHRQLVDEIGIKEDKVVTIRNALDFSRIGITKNREDLKKSLGILPTHTVIGGVGHLIYIKGYHYLVEAAERVVDKTSKVKFILIGEGNQRKYLEKMVEDKNLGENFVFVGKVKNVFDYYQIMDIFVHPSLSEGLPRVVMEAMYCGLPVIATSVGGTPEVVEDGRTGILIPPKNSEALSQSIIYLLQNPQKKG